MPPEPTYDLCYRADMRILVLRWLQPASFEEAKAAYRAALGLAQRHQCGNWVLDARRRERVDYQFMSWLVEHFIGEAVQQLAPVRFKWGIISTFRHLAHFSAAIVASQATMAQMPQPLPYRAYVSLEEDQTLRWLLADDGAVIPKTAQGAIA